MSTKSTTNIIDQAKTAATNIIEAQSLTAPFNISSIARSKGIEVLVADEDFILNEIKENEPAKVKKLTPQNVVAYFDKRVNKLYLAKNNSGNVKRKRFTVAHELGHYELGHNNSFRVIAKEDIYDYEEQPEEVAANYFAGYLLVPDKDITRVLAVLYPAFEGEKLVRKLADIFVISLEAMRIRLNTFIQENRQWKNLLTLKN